MVCFLFKTAPHNIVNNDRSRSSPDASKQRPAEIPFSSSCVIYHIHRIIMIHNNNNINSGAFIDLIKGHMVNLVNIRVHIEEIRQNSSSLCILKGLCLYCFLLSSSKSLFEVLSRLFNSNFVLVKKSNYHHWIINLILILN